MLSNLYVALLLLLLVTRTVETGKLATLIVHLAMESSSLAKLSSFLTLESRCLPMLRVRATLCTMRLANSKCHMSVSVLVKAVLCRALANACSGEHAATAGDQCRSHP